MTIPAAWKENSDSLRRRLMNLAHKESFQKTMAGLLNQGLIFTQEGQDGYGVTDKGWDAVLEDLRREEAELREAAQNFNSMSLDEREKFMAQACFFFYPNAPKEVTQDEIDEVLLDVLQRTRRHAAQHSLREGRPCKQNPCSIRSTQTAETEIHDIEIDNLVRGACSAARMFVRRAPVVRRWEDQTVNQRFLELGLWKIVDGKRETWGPTALGAELNAQLLSVFAGNWFDGEMPMILRENGLITEDEEDEIYLRFEGRETS